MGKKNSIYKGVHFYEDFELNRGNKKKPWKVEFQNNGEQYKLGYYPTEREAAIVHDKFVIKNNIDRKLNILKPK